MYKKIAFLIALSPISIINTYEAPSVAEWKPSYFAFSHQPLKKIYHHGAFQIQGSLSIPVSNYINLYGSIGIRAARGHAINSNDKTKLIVIPIDMGPKVIFFNRYQSFYYFFSIGPRFFYLHQHNSSPYVAPTINNGGVGFFTNTGFTIILQNHFSCGFFGEYSYEKNSIISKIPEVYSSGKTQMGGFAFGMSIGYTF